MLFPISRCSLAILVLVIAAGCSRPDQITIFDSPVKGIYYTVEDYSPVSGSATSRVYAHFGRTGKAATRLVLEGEKLTIRRVTWTSQDHVTLCVDGGTSTTFHDEITLSSEDNSITLYNKLKEHCDY